MMNAFVLSTIILWQGLHTPNTRPGFRLRGDSGAYSDENPPGVLEQTLPPVVSQNQPGVLVENHPPVITLMLGI